jgi:hypothetical protein
MECRRQAAACEIEAITEEHEAIRAALFEMARCWTELANHKDHLQAVLRELGRPG